MKTIFSRRALLSGGILVLSLAILLLSSCGKRSESGESSSAAHNTRRAPTDPKLREADDLHREGKRWLRDDHCGQAEICFSNAYAIRTEKLGPLDSDTLASLYGWAKSLTYLRMSRPDSSEALKRVKQLQADVTRAFPGHIRRDLIESYGLEEMLYEQMLVFPAQNGIQGKEAQSKRDALQAKADAAGKKLEELQAQAAHSGEEPEGENLTEDPEEVERKRIFDEGGQRVTPALLERFSNDPSAHAALIFAQAMKDGMKTNYHSELEGRNDMARLLADFEKTHPEEAKLMTGGDPARGILPSALALPENPPRHQPQAWLGGEWLKWKTILEGGVPLEAQILMKSRAGPFESVPVEMEPEPAVMAQLVLQFKGLVLEFEVRLHATLATSTNAEVQACHQKLMAAQQKLDELSSAATAGQRSPAAMAAYGQAYGVRQELRTQAIRFIGEVQTNQPATATVAQAIPPGAALVEFLRYGRDTGATNLIEARYGVLVLKSDGAPRWVSLATAEVIENLVKQYHEQIRYGSNSPAGTDALRTVLQKLQLALWNPLTPALDGATNVFIAPDAALHLVSFATLLNGERFLAQDFEIRYVTSGRDLLKAASPPAGKLMEIWDDPDFGPASSSLGDRLRRFFGGNRQASRAFFQTALERLPNTADEARGLRTVAEQKGFTVRLHEGADATKSALLQVRRPFLLHLATHGFFVKNELAGARSGIGGQLSGAGSGTDLSETLFGSGLALAGANPSLLALSRGEFTGHGAAGLAFAAELAALDLNTTWMATLSACDTDVGGMAEGEDVLALKRALLQAGAQNVLCTLWRVNDNYTAKFMQDFYTAALAAGDAGGALATLQRRELSQSGDVSLSEKVRHAGPFVLTTSGPQGCMSVVGQ